MPQPVFCLHNLGHAGDVILSRALIKEIMTAYPEVKIILICRSSNYYLWKDFGVETVPIDDKEIPPDKSYARVVPVRSKYMFDLQFFIKQIGFSFGISYRTLVHTYNSYLEDYGIYEKYRLDDKQETPFPELPKGNPAIRVKDRAVMVENGCVRSNQTSFDMNEYLQELTEMFPLLNFYCSAKPGFTADNVIDCSGFNLIELSELSKSCFAFLTKCSGVNAATTIDVNKYKLRCFAGVTDYTMSWWLWEIPENPVIHAKTKQEIIDFFRLVTETEKHCRFMTRQC